MAIAHHVGLHRMPPILKEFNERHPKVKLDIRFEDSDKAFMGVEQGDIEFAVITLPSVLPDKLIKQIIWHDELKIMVGNEHPLANDEQVDLSTLARYPCVLTSQGTETHQVIYREFEMQGLELDVQMQTNNLETLKMLTAAGLGWSLLPVTMYDNSIKALELGIDFSRNLGLVAHNKRSLSNAAQALRSLIEES